MLTLRAPTVHRSSNQRCSIEISVLRNFAQFTGKHLCQSLFFNNVAGLRPVTLLKRRPWHRYFPVNFVKFLRTPFLQSTSGPLLLSLGFNHVLEKLCDIICQITVSKTVCRIFLIFFRLRFINNLIVKSNFSEP